MSTTDGELRIGDAEREHVRGRLERHAADGRLTLDELAERMAEVYAARTAPDLRRAERELPALPGDAPAPGLLAVRPPQVVIGRRRAPVPAGPIVAVAVLAVWIAVAATTGFWFFPFWPLLFFAFAGRGRGWGGRGWDGRGDRPDRWGGTRYV